MLPPSKITVDRRVQLHVSAHASLRHYRDLRAFSRFCIERIEQDVGRAARWTITIAPSSVCYACEVIVEHDGLVVRADGTGFDGAVAGRDAFCKVEKLLRANCARIDASNRAVARVAL